MEAHQDYAVTTHRLLALSRADNDSICKPCKSPDFYFYFWSSLSSSYLMGYQVKGDVKVSESIFVHCLPCIGSTTTASVAVSLNYAFNSSQIGKPISVLTINKSAKHGLMEDPVISAVRYVLGTAQASSSAFGFERYAPPQLMTQTIPIDGMPPPPQYYNTPMKSAPY